METDYYLMGDQPMTCPKCGARSEIVSETIENEIFIQEHECLIKVCQYHFTACSD